MQTIFINFETYKGNYTFYFVLNFLNSNIKILSHYRIKIKKVNVISCENYLI